MGQRGRLSASGLALGGLLTLAMVLRLAIGVASWDRVPVDDERAYDECARGLLAGRGISTETPFFVSPGGGTPTSLWGCLQPLYVASSYTLFGVRQGPLYLLNALVGLVTVAASFRLGQLIGGLRGGLCAGFLVAVDAYLVKFTATILSETLYVALLALALVVLLVWSRSGRLLHAAFAGGLLGAAALSRATAFHFAPVALVWLLLERRRLATRRALGLEALVFCGALGAVIAPWVVRNRLVHDRPVFLDTKAGWNLYSFLHPAFEPIAGTAVPIPPAIVVPGTSESRRNEILVNLALENLRTSPVHALAIAPAKVALLLSPFPGRLTEPGHARLKTLFVLPLELIALVGVIRLRFRNPGSRLLGLFILFYLAVHAVMTGGPRFRVPLDPALATLAGAAVARSIREQDNLASDRILFTYKEKRSMGADPA